MPHRNTALLTKTALAALMAGTLISCGGGGDGSGGALTVIQPPAPVAPVAVPIDLPIRVSGLDDGEVTFTANDRTQTVSENGLVTLEDIVGSGGDISLAVTTDPFGQQCEFEGPTEFTNVEATLDTVNLVCIDVSVVSVRVQDFATGTAITNTTVTLSQPDLADDVPVTVDVDENGVAVFELPVADSRLVLSTLADGFAAQSEIFPALVDGKRFTTTLSLVATAARDAINGGMGGSLTYRSNAIVDVPPNAFIDASGETVTGDVIVEATPIDPSGAVELAQGDLAALGGPVESFGVIDVVAGIEGGDAVSIANGSTITLRIPVAERVSAAAPPVLPLFYYDEAMGRWVEEGTAMLTTLPSGDRLYEGTVGRLGTWSAALIMDTVLATGCVVNPFGEPLSGVVLSMEGADYIGRSYGTTDEFGAYTLPVRENSDQFITAALGAQSRTISVTSGTENFTFASPSERTSCLEVTLPENTEGQAVATLTWGQDPTDLDTYFYGFSPTDALIDSFQIAYFNKSFTFAGTTIFLDVDDVTSFGPEVLTIPRFPFAGTYMYGVDLFAGAGSIQDSPARVELNFDNTIRVYTPPAGLPTRCWAVFQAVVDEDGNVTIEEIGTWEAREYCTSGTGFLPTPIMAEPASSGVK